MPMRRCGAIAISAGVLLASLTSTGANARQHWEIARGTTSVGFMGVIDRAAAAALAAELREGDVLLIRSPGGVRSAALDLATVLKTRDITLDVNGQCYSACALYLALGANQVHVGFGSTLLFHNTTSYWTRLVVQRPDLFSHEEVRRVRAADAGLRALLEDRGISAELLDCIDAATAPRFDEARLNDAPPLDLEGVSSRVFVPTDFDFVWLAPNVLAQFGVRHISTDWTVEPADRAGFGEMRGLRIRWVDHVDQCRGASSSSAASFKFQPDIEPGIAS